MNNVYPLLFSGHLTLEQQALWQDVFEKAAGGERGNINGVEVVDFKEMKTKVTLPASVRVDG